MRKIEIQKWTAKDKDGNDINENTLNILSVLIANQDPANVPRGLDNFRLFSRLTKAFDYADKNGTLVLEEPDYAFMKKMLNSDLPSHWGLNPNIVSAVDSFMDAKEE